MSNNKNIPKPTPAKGRTLSEGMAKKGGVNVRPTTPPPPPPKGQGGKGGK